MNRERALKVVLVLVGLLFLAGVYPIVMYLWRPGNESPGDAMMLSLYVTLGVFLLLAARNPSANRSLIAFTAWSSFAHASVMAVMAIHLASERRDLLSAVAVLAIIRCSPNRAGSGKAVRRAATASRCVGRTLEKQALSRTGSDPPAC